MESGDKKSIYKSIQDKYEILVEKRRNHVNSEWRLARKCIKKLNQSRNQSLSQAFHCFDSGNVENGHKSEAEAKNQIFLSNDSIIQRCPLKVLTPVKPLPPMRCYMPIHQNIITEDQTSLDYLPYLGEVAISEVDELISTYGGYNVTTSSMDDSIIVNLVEAVAEQISEANGGGYNGLDVFQAISEAVPSKMSPRELSRKFNCMKKKQPVPEDRWADAPDADININYQERLRSMQSHFCRRCLIYNCLLHKEPSKPELAPHDCFREKDRVEPSPDSCGPNCYKSKNNETSSKMPKNREWTKADQSFFNMFNRTFPGNFCLISQAMQTKLCRQVRDFAMLDKSEMSAVKKPPPFVKRTLKRKVPNLAKTSDVARNYHTPCDHEGRCSNGCPCFDKKTYCEKFCKCSAMCSIRFPGCNCKGKCVKMQCCCYMAIRECDPDICRCQIREEQPSKCCKNVAIQRKMKKNLLLAPSDIAGWGIFSHGAIEKNEFISEYCGELISQEEAERRGKIYESYRCSYLFDLSSEYSIDPTRKGNKIRFANHSDTPNCYPRTVNVNGDYRIGLYAKRNIEAREELFLDYNYGPSEKLKYLKK